ncbi:MAG: serine/threonine protein kinase, partial [Deltaproteobacteria bacterium]|nr:serine/threonine protein kinase [Deltaproteobacteria bacterium]
MFAPGTTVGRYAIQRQLGEGSFGTVFLALHVSLHSLHAVKVLKPELARDPDVRERFLAEGRIQAQIAHPHLVRVTDILEEPSPALVMDFVDGKTLDEWLSGLGRALRADEVLGILVPVLDAVGAVHARGVVHRDIKPENIIISRDSSGRLRPVLSDFGIAKLQQDTTVSAVKRRTELGSSIGTPEYMSPEQVRGRDEIDARSDIFAIGVVAYELVAGRHPFADVDTFETKRNIVEGRYVPLGTPVSHAVADAVHRALAVDRAARYPDCESFHRAIELAYGDEPTQSTSGVYRIPEGSGTRQRRPNGPPAVNVPRPAQGGQSPPAPPPPPEARPVSPSSPGPVPGAGGSPPPREGARTGLLLFGGVAALLLVAGGLAVVGLVVARRLGSTPPVTAPAPSRAPVAAPAPSPVP